MGQPSKPISSSFTAPGNRVTPSSQSYFPAMHAHLPNSPYTVPPGPPTSPPPLNYVGSPYACSPLPVVEPSHDSTGPAVHPYFALSYVPLIVWDVTLPCATITTADLQSLSPKVLSEPATNPPLSAFTIVSSQLPWLIEARASSAGGGAYVTVSDVLSTIHRALQLLVTPIQLDLLPSPEVKDRIGAAYASRVRGRPEYEGTDRGVKRVDYLMGRNRFLGLSRTQFGPGVWSLNVS